MIMKAVSRYLFTKSQGSNARIRSKYTLEQSINWNNKAIIDAACLNNKGIHKRLQVSRVYCINSQSRTVLLL